MIFLLMFSVAFASFTPGINVALNRAPGVGHWGGSCTCPDGSVFQVGDNHNSCGSLACIGGVSGTCNRFTGPWSQRKVYCAPIEKAQLPSDMKYLGGGFCTSGYYKGWDGKGIESPYACAQVCLSEPECVHAAFSLGRTCSRYNRLECTLNSDRDHTTFTKLTFSFSMRDSRVGGWGGSCTCPDGSVYQAGDNYDHCGSLACINGVSGTCNRRNGPWSGRKVICGASDRRNLFDDLESPESLSSEETLRKS